MLRPDVVIIVMRDLTLFHPVSASAKAWAQEVFKGHSKGTVVSPAFPTHHVNGVVDTLSERGLRVFVF